MTAVEFFPPLNASLNALSGVFLLIGYVLIRQKRIQLHKRFMLAACTSSVLFLICYVTYHTIRGGVVSNSMPGTESVPDQTSRPWVPARPGVPACVTVPLPVAPAY